MFKKFINAVLDILLPQKCIGCKKEGEILCENCITSLPRCTEYVGNDNFAVFSYKNKLTKDIIHSLKYKGRKNLAEMLGRYLYDTVLEEISIEELMENDIENQKIIIIPVPIHDKKLAKRGFNQSEEIAVSFFSLCGEDNFCLKSNALKRIKETDSQVSVMNREKRLKNLNDAFCVNEPQNIFGKTIILIDDVITTGATIEECRKTLKKEGAKRVLALSLAH